MIQIDQSNSLKEGFLRHSVKSRSQMTTLKITFLQRQLITLKMIMPAVIPKDTGTGSKIIKGSWIRILIKTILD